MLQERRDWIREEMANKGMKPPKDMKGFYTRFDV